MLRLTIYKMEILPDLQYSCDHIILCSVNFAPSLFKIVIDTLGMGKPLIKFY